MIESDIFHCLGCIAYLFGVHCREKKAWPPFAATLLSLASAAGLNKRLKHDLQIFIIFLHVNNLYFVMRPQILSLKPPLGSMDCLG